MVSFPVQEIDSQQQDLDLNPPEHNMQLRYPLACGQQWQVVIQEASTDAVVETDPYSTGALVLITQHYYLLQGGWDQWCQ